MSSSKMFFTLVLLNCCTRGLLPFLQSYQALSWEYLLQDVVQPPNAFFKQKKIEPKSRKEFYALQMARVGEGLGCHSL